MRDEGFELLRGHSHWQYEHMLQTLIQKYNAHLLNLLVCLMGIQNTSSPFRKKYTSMLDY